MLITNKIKLINNYIFKAHKCTYKDKNFHTYNNHFNAKSYNIFIYTFLIVNHLTVIFTQTLIFCNLFKIYNLIRTFCITMVNKKKNKRIRITYPYNCNEYYFEKRTIQNISKIYD